MITMKKILRMLSICLLSNVNVYAQSSGAAVTWWSNMTSMLMCSDYLSYYDCLLQADETSCTAAWCDSYNYGLINAYDPSICPVSEYTAARAASEVIYGYLMNDDFFHSQAIVQCKSTGWWTITDCEARCDLETAEPSTSACKDMCRVNSDYTVLNNCDTCTSRLSCVGECTSRAFSFTHCNRECTSQCGTEWVDISWTIYLDANKEQTFDAGDTWIQSVTVYLNDANGNQIASTTTDLNGNYSFVGLAAGTYQVTYVNSTVYVSDSSQEWTISGTASDAMLIESITLVWWEMSQENNFGLVEKEVRQATWWGWSSSSSVPVVPVSVVEEDEVENETPVVEEEVVEEEVLSSTENDWEVLFGAHLKETIRKRNENAAAIEDKSEIELSPLPVILAPTWVNIWVKLSAILMMLLGVFWLLWLWKTSK